MANCGNCRVCRRVDCGNCKTCKNKVKFGGPGTWKQTCLLLQNKGCLNRSSDDITVISNPSTPKNTTNTITNQKNSVKTPQQNASSFSSNNKPITSHNGNGNANNQKNSVKPASSQAPTTPEKFLTKKPVGLFNHPKLLTIPNLFGQILMAKMMTSLSLPNPKMKIQIQNLQT